MKTSVATMAVTALLTMTGCTHYERTYVLVMDWHSKKPIASARVTASLYDPLNPNSGRTHTTEVLTKSNGLVSIKIPMCSTRGINTRNDGRYAGEYLYWAGPPMRYDPNTAVGPELIVAKEGFDTYITYETNEYWKTQETSRKDPLVVYLLRTAPQGFQH